MTIVAIYGPQGSGKTRRCAELMRHYKCSKIIDGWNGTSPLPDGSLAITSAPPPYKQAGVLAISICAAKSAIGRAAP
jgi:hypothetical protein